MKLGNFSNVVAFTTITPEDKQGMSGEIKSLSNIFLILNTYVIVQSTNTAFRDKWREINTYMKGRTEADEVYRKLKELWESTCVRCGDYKRLRTERDGRALCKECREFVIKCKQSYVIM